MRRIKKGFAPVEFVTHRATSVGATFDNAPKQPMRDALHREQEGLCAYCTCELAATTDAVMKIEHHEAQSTMPARALDWTNLLGVCKGGEGKPRPQQTCDSRRGNREVPLDPTLSAIERQIDYELGSARIVAVEASQQAVLDDVLGLNLETLRRARRAVLEAFQERMKETKPVGTWSTADYESCLATFSRTRRGTTRGFIGIVEWMVRQRRLRAARQI